jgi:hypothetical protein
LLQLVICQGIELSEAQAQEDILMTQLFVETKLPMTVPMALQLPLQANPHLVPRFFRAVMSAVMGSFEHKDTAMRKVTEREVKRRWELCSSAVVMMYYEYKVGLLHALDVLPGVLRDTLLQESDSLKQMEGPGQRRWKPSGGETETMEADLSDDLQDDA